jgi:prophage regulatory protein
MMDSTRKYRLTTDNGEQPLLLRGIIRAPQVEALTGLSRSSIYRKEVSGQFPKRRKLGDNSVGWITSEVIDWIGSTEHQPLAQEHRGDSAHSAQEPAAPATTNFDSLGDSLQMKAKRPRSGKENVAAINAKCRKEARNEHNKK